VVHKACQCDNEKILKILVEAGASVNAKDKQLKTPLMIAALNANYKAVNYLVTEKSADPAMVCSEGKKARNYAEETFEEAKKMAGISKKTDEKVDALKKIINMLKSKDAEAENVNDD
jgi:ankyrin repeat protein